MDALFTVCLYIETTNLGQEEQCLGEVSGNFPPQVKGQLLLRLCGGKTSRIQQEIVTF